MKLLICSFVLLVFCAVSSSFATDIVVDLVNDTDFLMELVSVEFVTEEFAKSFPESSKPDLEGDILKFRITGWQGDVIWSFMPPTPTRIRIGGDEEIIMMTVPPERSIQRLGIYDILGEYPNFRISACQGTGGFSFKQEGAELVITREAKVPQVKTKNCQMFVRFVAMRETFDSFSFLFIAEFTGSFGVSFSPFVRNTVFLEGNEAWVLVTTPKALKKQVISFCGSTCFVSEVSCTGSFSVYSSEDGFVTIKTIKRNKLAPPVKPAVLLTTWGSHKQ